MSRLKTSESIASAACLTCFFCGGTPSAQANFVGINLWTAPVKSSLPLPIYLKLCSILPGCLAPVSWYSSRVIQYLGFASDFCG